MLYAFCSPKDEASEWLYLWSPTELKLTKMLQRDVISQGLWRGIYNIDGRISHDQVYVKRINSMNFASPDNKFYVRSLNQEVEVCIRKRLYRIGAVHSDYIKLYDSVSKKCIGYFTDWCMWMKLSIKLCCFFLCCEYIVGVYSITETGTTSYNTVYIIWGLDGNLVSLHSSISEFETPFKDPRGQGVLAKLKMLYGGYYESYLRL